MTKSKTFVIFGNFFSKLKEPFSKTKTRQQLYLKKIEGKIN